MGKKAEQKKREKIVEDKTFGLKNKNRSSKVQSYIQSISKSVHQGNPNERKRNEDLEAKRKAREEKKAFEMEMARLFKDVSSVNKREQSKQEEEPENAEAEGMDKNIGCAPEDYLFRPEDFDEVQYDERRLEEQLEAEREALKERNDLTPVTEESFQAWKAAKRREAAEADAARVRKAKAGEGKLRGWDLWQMDKELFVDDEDADEKYERESISDEDVDEGITLEYETSVGDVGEKHIDLLTLKPDTNLELLASEIIKEEPLLSMNLLPQIVTYLQRLVDKLRAGYDNNQSFSLFKTLRAHMLPLTNCAFNKGGDSFITGSYDRTCKVWDTATGNEIISLEGHRNVVYSVSFNNPYGDRVATGSFDKTCRIWDARTGTCYCTLAGHMAEIVCMSFNPQSTHLSSGSMDYTAKVWNVETGQELYTLLGHTAEIVSLNFNTNGDLILTGSFDTTAKLWDVRTGKCVHTLSAHRAEISSTQFNFAGNLCVTGCIDRTSRVWDVSTGKCVSTLRGHTDEILDVAFSTSGSQIVTASADATARVYDTATFNCVASLIGHEGEISKVQFNPQGTKIISAANDKTCRLWSVETGQNLQTLTGHNDEIFSCAFNYEGDTILTGSKDNTCGIWKS